MSNNKREEWVKKSAGYSSLGDILLQVTKPAFKGKNQVEARIITNWPDIIGNVTFGAVPKKVTFPQGKKLPGTLHIEVEGAYALEVMHMEPVIIERIATYFGYQAIDRIKIVQKPL